AIIIRFDLDLVSPTSNASQPTFVTSRRLFPHLLANLLLGILPARKMRQPLCLVSTCCNSSCFFRPKDWSKRREAAPLRQEQGGGTPGGVMERLATPLVAATAILALSAPVAYGQSISNGAALFQKACIGCHDMGGNLLQPGATLFMKDLQRNGVATEEGIYDITYYGKGRMPAKLYHQGFGERCTPRGQCTFGPRLQEDEIKLLAEFVKAQADRGWPKIESYGD
ncbi:unnamed protein product, partial [Musa acuminata subsp. malaccensis]